MHLLMKITKCLLPVVSAIVLIGGCTEKKSGQEDSAVQYDPVHNASNSLDVEGTYTGVVPCGGCEGVETTLILSKGQTYELRTRYLGKSDNVFVKKGMYEWLEDGNTIRLKGIEKGERADRYFVSENRVIQLDLEGNHIEGELADKYVLGKQAGN